MYVSLLEHIVLHGSKFDDLRPYSIGYFKVTQQFIW